jgi:mRNA-degrading endonuclease YafQ of YafQ-DinJ toxin-antitoxin module
MTIVVVDFDPTKRFDNDFDCAPPDVQQGARAALKLLQSHPTSSRLRLHNLKGYPKPTIWKIDVRPNKSWQITFELTGTTARLLRLGTHRQVDDSPR